MRNAILLVKALVGACLATVTAAWAQSPWLVVVGDAQNPAEDTVQVDPAPVKVADHVKTLRVKVNRANQRVSWTGQPYRSYQSLVQFDCHAMTARYLSITYYLLPLWGGSPLQTVDYSTGTPRPMQFRDIEPNPAQRIMAAACAAVVPSR